MYERLSKEGISRLGFAMVAASHRRVEESMKAFGWIYFALGNLLLFGHCCIKQLEMSDIPTPLSENYEWLLTGVLSNLVRAHGEWILMIGLLGVSSRYVKNYPNNLKKLVEISMPFYLTHQQIVVRLHGGLWEPRIGTWALDHSLIQSIIRLHRSLVHSLAHSLAHLIASELIG